MEGKEFPNSSKQDKDLHFHNQANIIKKLYQAENININENYLIKQFIEEKIKFNPKNLKGLIPEKNLNFLPRENCSPEAIYDLLNSSSFKISGVLLTGLPGMGKTQTVLAYANLFAQKYDVIIWLKSSENNLSIEYKRLFSSMLIEVNDLIKEKQLLKDLREDTLIEFIQHTLESSFPRILYIFDNGDDYPSLSRFIPKKRTDGKGVIHCLFTSRRQFGWPDWVDHKSLEAFSPHEAKKYILRILPDTDGGDTSQYADELAKLLHYFPLSIAQAVAYIKQPNLVNNIKDYINQYKECSDYLLAINSLPKNQYEASLLVSWTSLKEKMININPVAIELLELCSYLYPDEIEASLFVCYPTHQLLAAMDFLFDYSLVIPLTNKKTFKIHRMLQDVVRLSDKNNYEQKFNKIMKIVTYELGNVSKPFLHADKNLLILYPDIKDILITHGRLLIEHSMIHTLQDKLLLANLIYEIINCELFITHSSESIIKYINYAEHLSKQNDLINKSRLVILKEIKEAIKEVKETFNNQVEGITPEKIVITAVPPCPNFNRELKFLNESVKPKRITVRNTKRQILNSRIIDREINFTCEQASELHVINMEITSDTVEIDCQNHSKLNLTNSSIESKNIKICLQKDSYLHLSNVTLRADRIEISINFGTLHLTESFLHSRKIAIRAESSDLIIKNSFSRSNNLEILVVNNSVTILDGLYIRSMKTMLLCEDSSYFKRFARVFIRSDILHFDFNNQILLVNGLFVNCQEFLLQGEGILGFNAFIQAEQQNLACKLYCFNQQKNTQNILFLSKKINVESINLALLLAISRSDSLRDFEIVENEDEISITNLKNLINSNVADSQKEASYFFISEATDINEVNSVSGIMIVENNLMFEELTALKNYKWQDDQLRNNPNNKVLVDTQSSKKLSEITNIQTTLTNNLQLASLESIDADIKKIEVKINEMKTHSHYSELQKLLIDLKENYLFIKQSLEKEGISENLLSLVKDGEIIVSEIQALLKSNRTVMAYLRPNFEKINNCYHKLLSEKIMDTEVKQGLELGNVFSLGKDEDAFLRSAQQGEFDSLQDLLQKGVNINVRDNGINATALHYAASNGNLHIVDSLLKAGSDPTLRDKNGQTAMDWAKAALEEAEGEEETKAYTHVVALLQKKLGTENSGHLVPKSNTSTYLEVFSELDKNEEQDNAEEFFGLR